MNKKTVTILIIALMLLLSICATSCSTSGTNTPDPYEEQIQLGYKYLSEMDYEQAIVAFDKAISIDAKRDTAYIGKADTYLAKGGDDMIANIDESLKVGYEVTQSEGIVDAYIRIADELVEAENYDAALELLQKGYEATENEKLKEKIAEVIDRMSSAFLKNLYSLFEAGNMDGVWSIMGTDEFNGIAAYVTDTEPVCYLPMSTIDAKSGNGVGIYKMQDKYYVEKSDVDYIMQDKYFVYYGDYADNMRSGHGIWLMIHERGNYKFEGQWANDKPNGEGKEFDTIRITEATYRNGLYNGDVTYIGDSTLHKFTCIDGVAPKVEELNDGSYIVANDINGGPIRIGHRVGSKYGVKGYEY